jgi:hypothetical protein
MATLYVVTARSSDTFRIERVHLDRDQERPFPGTIRYRTVEPVELAGGDKVAPSL